MSRQNRQDKSREHVWCSVEQSDSNVQKEGEQEELKGPVKERREWR